MGRKEEKGEEKKKQGAAESVEREGGRGREGKREEEK